MEWGSSAVSKLLAGRGGEEEARCSGACSAGVFSLDGRGGEGGKRLRATIPSPVSDYHRWRRSWFLWCAPAGRGGVGSGDCMALVIRRRRWSKLQLLYRADSMAAIFAAVLIGRKGGLFSTSDVEALVESCCWSSTAPCSQVVRPRGRGVGLQLWFFVGEGTVSSVWRCALDLGVDAPRSPASSGGGGLLALDCFSFYCARVLFAIWQALSTNIMFFCKIDVKGHSIILYPPQR